MPKVTLSSRLPQAKPASGLNCHPEMYISWGNNIFVRKLTFVPFTRLIEQPTAGAHDRCRIASKAKVRKDTDSLNATSRSRVLGNIIKQIRVFLSEARAWCALGQQRGGIRQWL